MEHHIFDLKALGPEENICLNCMAEEFEYYVGHGKQVLLCNRCLEISPVLEAHDRRDTHNTQKNRNPRAPLQGVRI